MARGRKAIQVKLESSTRTYRFKTEFVVGRSPDCDVVVADAVVSSLHATIRPEGDRWYFVDEASTNGSFLDGTKCHEAELQGRSSVRLGGVNGPRIFFTVESAPTDSAVTAGGVDPVRNTPEPSRATVPAVVPVAAVEPPAAEAPAAPVDRPGISDPDLHSRYEQHLRNRLQAQRQRFVMLIGVIMGFVLILFGYVGFQFKENSDLKKSATDLFYLMRAADRNMVELSAVIVETGDPDLQSRLESLRAQRRRQQEMYAGYVREMGTYRKLDEVERLIYQTARAFNECEFEIPKPFLEAVKSEIRNTWGGPMRQEWQRTVKLAEESGYTRSIAERMERYGLPPEFFYLAMQESRFNRFAVGPPTRYGRAKGMWQFIPTTAENYGLVPVFRDGAANPVDARHNVDQSTAAAASYLSDIYTKLTQASGLLAMASYNWGEHRVISKMAELYGDLPDNARDRSYWTFLSRYERRMPAETKDYVLKIFAAAVVGSNPRMFGIEMDDPLAKYRRSAGLNE